TRTLQKPRTQLPRLLPSSAELRYHRRQDKQADDRQQEIDANLVVPCIEARNIFASQPAYNPGQAEQNVDDRTEIESVQQSLERRILPLDSIGPLPHQQGDESRQDEDGDYEQRGAGLRSHARSLLS